MARSLSVSARSGDAATFSILGSDTAIKGDLTASADLHIDGRIEGDITCKSIVQGEGSEITGAISAETVRIAGKIKGAIAAREVVILKTARIEGDITYDALTIEQGAQLEGRLSPSGGAAGLARRGADGEAQLILAGSSE